MRKESRYGTSETKKGMGKMQGALSLDRMSTGLRAYILLFFLTFTAALPGIFTMPALDRDESRFAQASKQMLETGDYITIRYQDGMRNKKPAGIHWLQAGSTALLSSAEAKQIWSYRVPSLLGAALAACAAFWAGIPLIGRRASFVGAALFGVGVLLLFETNMSKTDCVLVAITTLGVGAFVYLRNWLYKPKAMALLFWFCMGFGFLIKGPVTPMVAFLAIIFSALWLRRGLKWPAILSAGLVLVFLDNYFDFGPADKVIGYGIKAVGGVLLVLSGARFALDERREAWFRHLMWWPGPLLWVAMVLPWFLWIQSATDGAFFKGAVGKDLKDKVVSASEGHGGAPGYHTFYLILLFFPATLYLIPALRLGWQKARSALPIDHGVMFLIAWIVPTWIIFEFLPTKLPHYLLPAYPAIALLCGYAAVKLADGEDLPVSRWSSLIVFLIGATGLGIFLSPLGMSLLKAEAASDFKTIDAQSVLSAWPLNTTDFVLLIPFAVLIAACAVSFAVRRFMLATVLGVAATMVLSIHARVLVFPSQTWVQATVQARAALSELCALPDQSGCETHPALIQAYGYSEPSLVFTTGTDVLITPESNLLLPPASDVPVAAWVINLEDRISRDSDPVGLLREQAHEQGRCITESAPRYAANYSSGSTAHFIAVRIDAGSCGVSG